LTKSKHIQDGNLREGLEAITKALVEQLGVSRAAIWKMEELTEGIVLEKMFQRSSLEFVDGGQLLKKDFPLYFNSVVSEEVIVADDVHSHASLVEFKKGYLDTYNIVSMLDAPFYLNGKVGGVICCENQHQQKSWTQEDIDFIKSVADIVSLAYKSSESKNLLNKALHQAEELQAQEEEMRQQLEELTATQDALNEKMNALEETSKNLEIRERVLEYTTILSESDVYGNITFVNDKLCSVSQYDRSELVGKPHNVLRHPDMPKELFRNMWQTIKKGEVFKGVVKNKAKDGSAYWVDATIVPIKDDSGKIYKYVGARYHIEDIELAEALYDIQVKRLNLPPLPVKSERRRSA
jgi:PAS domain S-box-containing protein